MDAKTIGELIASLRRERQMSQNDLAEKLGVTNKAISRWETGRGYPDIEMLPKLAKEFGISIQELLDGEKLPQECLEDHVDRSVEYVCVYAGQQQRKQNKKIVFLVLIAAILALMLFIFIALRLFAGFYDSVMGSDSCVVANDYSSLTFRGSKYIPLPMNGYECTVGERIIDEVRIAGMPFIVKLFFSDSLYEVKGAPNNELLYLMTDEDGNISDYFVLESEYEKYKKMLTEANYSDYYATEWLDNGYTLEIPMTDDVVAAILDGQMVTASEIDTMLSTFRVHAFEENHLFYRWAGDLIRKDGKYYWSPSVYSDDRYGTYYMSHQYYRISDEFADALNSYFLYLCP